ncbi:MAG: hypothetical protein QNJ41_12875 [Xenococcaceae cyanobacterium MO_188.B32]|nr:hypothetical protein [Xenococcaceae cyanobacterium MO_188.B32]
MNRKSSEHLLPGWASIQKLFNNSSELRRDRGLAPNSQIFALADGAKGLKEALENSFPNLQFIERSSSS